MTGLTERCLGKSLMKSKKTIFNMLFLLLVFGLTMYYVFEGEDMGALARYLKQSDVRYWLAGTVLVVLFILSESVIIHYMMRSVGQPTILVHCFLYSFVGFFFSAIFYVSSEEWRKEGRTDLIIKMNDNGQKIIEFKIWGRNDYKEVVQQVTERYLTEFDSDGYIIMVNGNKKSIKDKYIEYITNENAGYIDNSLNYYTISNFEYYETRHRTAFSEYRIYHFIYNIFD